MRSATTSPVSQASTIVLSHKYRGSQHSATAQRKESAFPPKQSGNSLREEQMEGDSHGDMRSRHAKEPLCRGFRTSPVQRWAWVHAMLERRSKTERLKESTICRATCGSGSWIAMFLGTLHVNQFVETHSRSKHHREQPKSGLSVVEVGIWNPQLEEELHGDDGRKTRRRKIPASGVCGHRPTHQDFMGANSMKNHLASLVLSVLVGCHSAQTRMDGPGSTSPGSVQVLAQQDGKPQPVAAGQSLPSGSKFSVSVKAPATSYLYLALVSGSRMPTTIVPASGESPPKVEAGSSVTFPAGGGTFTLDDQPGTETVVAVFAPDLLNEAQLQSLLESAESSDAASRAGGEKTRDVPPIATTATRGGSPAGSSSGSQRIVVNRFSFVHAAR